MKSELKPCPFCGGEADIDEIAGNPDTGEPYAWGVGCKKCNIGWYEETKEKAIAMWNRRPSPSTAPLTIDELRKMDGEPVWTVPLDGSGIGEWTIITIGAQTEMLKALSPDTAYNECNYAKAWLAYRRKLKEN